MMLLVAAAIMLLPATMVGAAAPDAQDFQGELSQNDHLFRLVNSKEEITHGARYLVGGWTEDDGVFVMTPPSNKFYYYHYATKVQLQKNEYLVIPNESFARDREVMDKPLLLRGYGNADGLTLKYEFDDRYSLWGYGASYRDSPRSTESRQLPLNTYSYSTYGWQFSFDAYNDWGSDFNSYLNEETKGMFMRMPAREYGSYSNMDYTYVLAGSENLGGGSSGVYFQGEEQPGKETRVLLFKEICRHVPNEVIEVMAVAPTCLSAGYSRMYYCKGCMSYFDDAACTTPATMGSHHVPALGHDWDGDVCTRCHARAEVREFTPQRYNDEGYIQVARLDGKYYAMGLNPVEEGLEAVEVDVDEDGYLKADASKLAVIVRDERFSLRGEPSATLRVYRNRFQTVYYDVENNKYFDGLDDGWGFIQNEIMDEIYYGWDDELQADIQTYGFLYGKNNLDGETYETVLKVATDGTPYFGLQLRTYEERENIFIYYIQCAHSNLLHTPGMAATCLDPSIMESYFCDDCYSYFSDAKCHRYIDVDEYQPDGALGHHFEPGQDICTKCGEPAGIYRPVTETSQFNAGYRYMMVGHIGDQYYVLSRPTLQPFREYWDTETPDEDLRKVYMWDNKKLMATPVTLNADGSITANGNDMLEFQLMCIRNRYNEVDADMGSPFFLRTPWGIITDETNYDYGSITATFRGYEFKNWKYLTYGDETVPRRFTLAKSDFRFFDWMEEEYREGLLPENIRNATVEDNSVLMHRVWAGDLEEHGTYFLVREDGDTYFCPFNHFWDEWAEYVHPTAEVMIPTLYYCASKPMPHIDYATAGVSVYAEQLDEDDLEAALEEVALDGMKVVNIDLSNVQSMDISAQSLRDKIFSNDAVSNNSLVILPSESTLSGTNIVVDGRCDNISLVDGEPFMIPAEFASEDNPLRTLSVSYERLVGEEYVEDEEEEEGGDEPEIVSARMLANGVGSQWGTVCLPFAIKSNDDIQLYSLAEVKVDGYEGILTFNAIDEAEAGMPCIFRSKAGVESITLGCNDVALRPAATVQPTAVEGWSIVGTLRGEKIYSGQDSHYNYEDIARYAFRSDRFENAEYEGKRVAPFRAWLEQSGMEGALSTLYILANGEDEDAILEVDADGNLKEVGKDRIYNLQGQRTDAAKHGIYIRDGRKVAVR